MIRRENSDLKNQSVVGNQSVVETSDVIGRKKVVEGQHRRGKRKERREEDHGRK